MSSPLEIRELLSAILGQPILSSHDKFLAMQVCREWYQCAFTQLWARVNWLDDPHLYLKQHAVQDFAQFSHLVHHLHIRTGYGAGRLLQRAAELAKKEKVDEKDRRDPVWMLLLKSKVGGGGGEIVGGGGGGGKRNEERKEKLNNLFSLWIDITSGSWKPHLNYACTILKENQKGLTRLRLTGIHGDSTIEFHQVVESIGIDSNLLEIILSDVILSNQVFEKLFKKCRKLQVLRFGELIFEPILTSRTNATTALQEFGSSSVLSTIPKTTELDPMGKDIEYSDNQVRELAFIFHIPAYGRKLQPTDPRHGFLARLLKAFSNLETLDIGISEPLLETAADVLRMRQPDDNNINNNGSGYHRQYATLQNLTIRDGDGMLFSTDLHRTILKSIPKGLVQYRGFLDGYFEGPNLLRCNLLRRHLSTLTHVDIRAFSKSKPGFSILNQLVIFPGLVSIRCITTVADLKFTLWESKFCEDDWKCCTSLKVLDLGFDCIDKNEGQEFRKGKLEDRFAVFLGQFKNLIFLKLAYHWNQPLMDLSIEKGLRWMKGLTELRTLNVVGLIGLQWQEKEFLFMLEYWSSLMRICVEKSLFLKFGKWLENQRVGLKCLDRA